MFITLSVPALLSLLSHARDLCDSASVQSDPDGIWGDDRVSQLPPSSLRPPPAHGDPLPLRRWVPTLGRVQTPGGAVREPSAGGSGLRLPVLDNPLAGMSVCSLGPWVCVQERSGGWEQVLRTALGIAPKKPHGASPPWAVGWQETTPASSLSHAPATQRDRLWLIRKRATPCFPQARGCQSWAAARGWLCLGLPTSCGLKWSLLKKRTKTVLTYTPGIHGGKREKERWK